MTIGVPSNSRFRRCAVALGLLCFAVPPAAAQSTLQRVKDTGMVAIAIADEAPYGVIVREHENGIVLFRQAQAGRDAELDKSVWRSRKRRAGQVGRVVKNLHRFRAGQK